MSTTAIAPTRPRSPRLATQPFRILVASAGESSSIGAIHVALALARRKSASVHVLTVVKPFPHVAPSVLHASPPALVDEDNRRTALDAVRRQLGAIRGTKNWTARAAVGWPADSILSAAERWPASLLIVGLGEHGLIDRLIGSETAVAIARRSQVPVLAIPHAVRHLPTRAVAAIDFSDASTKAAMLAATLLGPNGVLTLLHTSMLVKDAPAPGTLADVYTTGAVDKLRALRDRIHRETKRNIECATASGEIVHELLAYVDREDCDLLAVGGHDQGMVDRLLLGSVRSRVLRQAQCPVLVAPHVVING